MFIYIEARIPAEKTEEDYELAVPMGRMQNYMDKLYFSGSAKNWALSSFYLHEIEEQIEEIAHSDIIENEADISLLAKTLLDQIDLFEEEITKKNQDVFIHEYTNLMGKCNDCHIASKHEYIKIKIPSKSMFENQDFN